MVAYETAAASPTYKEQRCQIVRCWFHQEASCMQAFSASRTTSANRL